MRVAALFYHQRAALGLNAFPELRMRLGPQKYRVPDICVVVEPEADDAILTAPPFLCVEILSTEDRASRMQHRLADYLAFGIPAIWVIDPCSRRAFVSAKTGMREAPGCAGDRKSKN
jgi:Uma2 family endonuclease